MVLLRLPGRHAARPRRRGRGQPGVARHAGHVIHADRKGLMFGLGSSFRRADGRRRRAAGPVHPGYRRVSPFVRVVLPAGVRQPGGLMDVPDPQPRAGTPARRPRARLGSYLRELPAVLRHDANFARFLVSQVLVILGTLGSPLHRVRTRGVRRQRRLRGDAHHGRTGQPAVGTPLIGWWGPLRPPFRRRGGSPAVRGCGAVMVAAPGAGWMYAAFALLTVSDAGLRVARPALPWTWAPAAGCRPTWRSQPPCSPPRSRRSDSGRLADRPGGSARCSRRRGARRARRLLLRTAWPTRA